MPLSWNEIKSRALAFTQEWKEEVSEHAEAQSFWNDFFFGVELDFSFNISRSSE